MMWLLAITGLFTKNHKNKLNAHRLLFGWELNGFGTVSKAIKWNETWMELRMMKSSLFFFCLFFFFVLTKEFILSRTLCTTEDIKWLNAFLFDWARRRREISNRLLIDPISKWIGACKQSKATKHSSILNEKLNLFKGQLPWMPFVWEWCTRVFFLSLSHLFCDFIFVEYKINSIWFRISTAGIYVKGARLCENSLKLVWSLSTG